MIESWDRRDRVTIVPCQNQSTVRHLGLSREQCESAAWAVGIDGQRYRGAAAINAALSSALGADWPMRLYGRRWIQWLEDRAYSLIAALRGYLPGTKPYCLAFPDRCAGEGVKRRGRVP